MLLVLACAARPPDPTEAPAPVASASAVQAPPAPTAPAFPACADDLDGATLAPVTLRGGDGPPVVRVALPGDVLVRATRADVVAGMEGAELYAAKELSAWFANRPPNAPLVERPEDLPVGGGDRLQFVLERLLIEGWATVLVRGRPLSTIQGGTWDARWAGGHAFAIEGRCFFQVMDWEE